MKGLGLLKGYRRIACTSLCHNLGRNNGEK